MHILMFSWEYPPHVVGGLGRHIAGLLPPLGDLPDVHLHLVTPRWDGGEALERAGQVTVHRVTPPAVKQDYYTAVRRTNSCLEGYARRLWRETGPFDLIHVHDWLVGFVGVTFKHRHKVPLLSTIHATERGRGRGHLHSDLSCAIHRAEATLVHESWRVIACSEYMAGEISGFFQCPRDKIDVIPNGVEAARFDRLGGVDLVHFRHAHVLPSEQIVFNVGRVVYEKGAQVLLKAMPRILAQEPSVKVMIAGKGPELESLHSLARSLNLEGKVLFPGYISDGDRDRFFRIADCAVFPSLYEPFGIVALEAMAAKCPLVVTKVGGFKDMIRHNEMGFTVYPGDPVSLARGVVHMLQHREQAAMCVEKAHRLVREEYNWERIAKRTADVCRRITAERAAIAW